MVWDKDLHVEDFKDILNLIPLKNPITGSKVTAVKSGESQTGWFCLVMELHQDGSATNGANPSSVSEKQVSESCSCEPSI